LETQKYTYIQQQLTTEETEIIIFTVNRVEGLSLRSCSGKLDESKITPKILEDCVDGARYPKA